MEPSVIGRARTLLKFILIAKDKASPVVFFPQWKTTLLVLLVVLVLLVLFPHYLFKKTLTYYHQPSVAMLSYLQAFQSVYPHDTVLTLAIIEQEIGLGQLSKADKQLAEFKQLNPTLSRESLTQIDWITYLRLRYQTYQTKLNTPQRIAYLGQLRRMARDMANQPLSAEQLTLLAQDNLSLAQAFIALKIYNNLFAKQALLTSQDLVFGASIAMQNNVPADSAKFYWAAFLKANSLHKKRQYAMKTFQALWAGNLLPQALAKAQELPSEVLDDRELLLYLARLSIAANQPERAEQYALSAIKLGGYADDAYQLAYQASIFNANIASSYALAQFALINQPNSLIWHKNLAQSASWMGDYNTGMREWLYVGKHTKNSSTLQTAISIAQNLGYDEVLATLLNDYLKVYPQDMKALLLLANTYNKLYQPQQALKLLKRINTLHPSRSVDELTATIYQDTGQWDKALSTWQAINHTSPSLNSVMAEASIYYTQGQFKQALESLRKGLSLASNNDTLFWDTLSQLAWMINDRPLAILGYSHHLQDASRVINLIQLEWSSRPKQALFYSLLGWNTFHHENFFLNALELAQTQADWSTIDQLLINLSTKELKVIASLQAFWQAQTNLYASLGAKSQQKNVLVQAVSLHPELLALKSDLLWFLMTNGESQWVSELMNDWRYSMHSPLLWHAFAEGYDVLNQFYTAIAMYQMHVLAYFDDNQVLIDYAAVLDKARMYQQAVMIREFVWTRAIQQKAVETLVQLAPFYVSGTEQLSFLMRLDGTDAMNIALNWMIERRDIDLIRFVKANYLHHGLPYKAELIVALANNDLPALQRFMEQPEQPFLRSERINAAIRLENTPLALTIAYNELTDRPRASEIYTDFEQYGIKEANYLRLGQDYQQFIDLIGPRRLVDTKFKLTNQWKIRPYFSRWDVSSNSPNFITNVPGQDLRLGIKLEEQIHRGMLTYSLGYRDALTSFMPLDVGLTYRLSSRWTGRFNVGVNQEVMQTAYMYIGGVQDQLNFTLFYNPAKYDRVQLGAEGLNYYSQGRHYLADGFNLHGLYERKLWLTYPDYTVSLFADVFQFNRNGNYGGDITRLFPNPTSKTLNYQQIIPNSYEQGGVVFSFGSTILDYTHAWRPYLWASVFYNTFVGVANDVKIGLNGSVFGRDSLYFYGERGTAQAVANATTYTVGARYSMYL